MKKILFYIITLGFLISTTGCNSDNEPIVDSGEENGLISFSLSTPKLESITRSNADFTINRLDLLICDNEERILQKVTAVANGTGKYTAQVVYSNKPRVVHFVANYDWNEWSDNFIGKDAREVLAGISTNQFTAWKRIELPGGITQQTPFGTTPIELISNMAKFTLQVQNGLTDVSFALYNYDRGTIATFNPRSGNPAEPHQFQEGIITVPHNAQLRIPSPADFRPMTGGAVFAFERDNASAGANYSCLIIKGKFNGQDTYYKIDIVDVNEVRQDILRNNSYHITISGVTNIGHSTIEAAVASAADNTNFSLDPSLEIFPSITDGVRKLEVDQNFIVVTNTLQSANFIATYSIRSGSTWNTQNEKMSVAVEAIPGYNPAVTSAAINNSTGDVSVTTNAIPASGELRSKIVVKVDYLDGIIPVKIYRSVTVVVRPSFVFQAWQDGTVANSQRALMTAKVRLPNNFPTELLPIEFRFKTNNFYPHDDNPMRFTIDNEVPVYIYTVYQKGVDIEMKFLSNRSNSAETIVVTADYCTPANMVIQ